ncbi:hypothetical protein BDZ91DRAFT_145083 [Kalaharituber pfeilii]|nr:hypothetical protein BDZ91DRAFT_145083 [Kalaharituber pfeilii]
MASRGHKKPNKGKAPESPRPSFQSTSAQQICLQFRQNGQCKYGSRCKYSHRLASSTGQGASNTGQGASNTGQTKNHTSANTQPRDPIEVKSREVGRMMSNTSFSPSQAERFLKMGLEIVDTNLSAIKQKFIQDLANEEGLRHIIYFVQAKYANGGAGLKTMEFWLHCVPFLKLITHQELRSSLVLENAVGTIYNVIYGHSGARAIPFFQQVAENLISATVDHQASEFGSAVCAAAIALHMTIDVNQSASIQQEFVDVARSLRKCYNSNNTDYVARLADTELRKVEAKLHLADAIPLAVETQQNTSIQRRHHGGLDFPGELSIYGPRHDNDKASIAEIQILPTPEEILCITRSEYVPLKDYDAEVHHLPPGISRILDTQFRLLREDTSGQLRDAVRFLNHSLATNPKKNPKQQNGTQTIIYPNVVLERFKSGVHNGLEVDVTFDQPPRVQRMKKDARKNWWRNCRYLQIGALLCFVHERDFIFLTVTDRKVDERPRRPILTEDSPADDLASHPTRIMVTMKLVNTSTDIRSLVTHYRRQFKARQGNYAMPYLVEFPGLLFASFDPILKVLQNMQSLGEIPFRNLIAPEGNEANQHPDADPANGRNIRVPPPLYLSRRSVTLDLSVITSSPTDYAGRLSHSVTRPCTLEALEASTTLDKGQCEALLAALSRELTLIQGPPGTGKSYLGLQFVRVLLHNRRRLNLGPIICVCYTNHALDQFLLDLLKHGVKNLVRLGSRSKAEELASYSLRNVSSKTDTTWVERHEIRSLKEEQDQARIEINNLCNELERVHHWSVLKNYLADRYPRIHQRLFGHVAAGGEEGEEDEDGERGEGGEEGEDGERGEEGQEWETVTRRRPRDFIDDWVNMRLFPLSNPQAPRAPRRTLEEIMAVDVTLLNSDERMRLKRHWEGEISRDLVYRLKRATGAFTIRKEHIEKLYMERDRRCLQEAEVIGVTTTGLASNATLLRKIVAKVMICEEAGEVLEAHTITALLPSVEHTILIGDHQQLRPHISNFELSMESRQGEKIALDESLFERLTRERYGIDKSQHFPFSTLDTQRRMHPSIANLVRETLYPELKDHEQVASYPAVAGMARRLFWMDHMHPEANADKLDPSSLSKSNEFEIEMVSALVKHLIRQGGYVKGDIAVLTPYLGQLQRLKRKLGDMFEILLGEKDQEELDLAEDAESESQPEQPTIRAKPNREVRKGSLLSELRLATVDNFQGEEAKVIVISLVRCNPAHRCGFLKTSNRINVLLSRACHGMYIIGSAATARPVKMWSDVITLLERAGNFGDALELRCPRHPEKEIFVREPDHFLRFSPEGGCEERCGKRLEDCGHTCIKKCHSNVLHRAVVCMERCIRALPGCNHACPLPCGKPCQKCIVRIPEVLLPCGHIATNVLCHQAQQPAAINCKKSVWKIVPDCNHEVNVACFVDVTKKGYKCQAICNKSLPCGHNCIARCWECRTQPVEGGTHVKCRSLCGRGFNSCQHSCTKDCHGTEDCGVCDKPCEIRCVHSKCTKKCFEACTPCAELCTWNCPHRGKCEMPCAVPCDILPCSQRCENFLECGHRCPSLCGEQCPSAIYCQQCATPEVLDTVVDFVSMEAYKDIDLDSDPVIFLSCGHFLCMETVDGLMQMNDVYEFDQSGKIIAQKPQSAWIQDIKPTQTRCPKCRGALRDINRYNRVAKGVAIEALTQKFLLTANRTFLELERQVSDVENSLHTTRANLARDLFNHLSSDPSLRASRKKQGETEQGGNNKTMRSFANQRYKQFDRAFRAVRAFVNSVAGEEQPYGRIYMLVADCIRRNRIADSSYNAEDISVNPRNRLQGEILRLRLKWAQLYDMLQIVELGARDEFENDKKMLRKDIMRSLFPLQTDCEKLEVEAAASTQPRMVVELKLLHARFVGLEIKLAPCATGKAVTEHGEFYNPDTKQRETLRTAVRREELMKRKRELERESLEEAAKICAQYPGSTRAYSSKLRTLS